MKAHYELMNDWWIKFGYLEASVPYKDGVECDLHKELHDAGYRG